MPNYRMNHYVPEWYQKRFLLPNQQRNEFHYLKLKPKLVHLDATGKQFYEKPISIKGPDKAFKQEDLYTQFFGNVASTRIEEIFFGQIDDFGSEALDFVEGFNHRSLDHELFQKMVLVMSLQKIRTPKGLGWLSEQVNTTDKNKLLQYMMRLRAMHATIWMESIWQISSAEESQTKFILSDHPVTIYNRRCGPRHRLCRGFNDPDIRLAGSHTLFPLSFQKILIITNYLWAIDPYQNPLTMRPNPSFFRPTIMNLTDVQINRALTEQEVRQINLVLKSRAHQFIASPVKEWLYPENHVSKSNWPSFGQGYLFMPDPRPIHYSTETLIGYQDGSAEAFDQYGRRPWDEDYQKEPKRKVKYDPLYRFKGEFAQIFGPRKRGLVMEDILDGTTEHNQQMHEYHLSLAK